MKAMTLKRMMWIASAWCVALYALAFWCEAATFGWEFDETILDTSLAKALMDVSRENFDKEWQRRFLSV
ncbi:MAG: hypothetical protein FWG50_01370 [Kiritimatiellaeota bacterium]|nr:hypothetical protein [Kiritimatiellota bacterium]